MPVARKRRARRGGTPGSGVVAVFDAATGDLRALLDDEHHLSDVRTAAAGALAARMMARRDSRVLGVIGTGTQAYLQTLALADELPLRDVRVWGRRGSHVQSLAAALHARRPDLRVIGVDSAQAAFGGADVVVTAASSTKPLVRPSWLTPGVHINAVGADDPTKAELTSDSLKRADRIVVDSRELTAVHGDLSRLAEEGRRVDAELGEVLAGSAPGRENDEEITICKLIGLGVQDLAAAEVALDMLGAPRRSTEVPAHAREVHRQTAEAGTPAVA
ncbi:ornithine cyclodeaminase family protein [Streptomyces pseudovenezuelae]|uniref:Ornithine cyclodeaminase family protein n=1 Tax=Streptomyces pseudovenezuelae TaxID=67350 RepID=A0ABZ1XD16_9ACTN